MVIMMRVKFTFDKMVSYWNRDKGAGVRADGTMDMGSWHIDASWMDETVTIDSVDEVQEALKKVLDSKGMPTDYFAIMDDGRMSFNTLENGDSEILDNGEEDKMHENGEQMYLCDYGIFVEIQHVYEPTVEQLKQMFPSADY